MIKIKTMPVDKDGATPTIATLYTKAYAKYRNRFSDRCEKLVIPYHIDEIKDIDEEMERVIGGRSIPFMVDRVLRETEGPVLFVGIDDLLIQAPKVPAGKEWDIGIMRNPELDQINTHLPYGPFIFINNTQNAYVFMKAWEANTKYGNDHRAQCAAIMMMMGFIEIADCQPWLDGCLEMTANKYRETIYL